MGDADRNGRVDSFDVALMLTYCAKQGAGMDYTFTEYAALEELLLPKLDVNGDGVLSAADAALMLTYIAYDAVGYDVSWGDLL